LAAWNETGCAESVTENAGEINFFPRDFSVTSLVSFFATLNETGCVQADVKRVMQVIERSVLFSGKWFAT
jgi:hypothetical protein